MLGCRAGDDTLPAVGVGGDPGPALPPGLRDDDLYALLPGGIGPIRRRHHAAPMSNVQQVLLGSVAALLTFGAVAGS